MGTLLNGLLHSHYGTLNSIFSADDVLFMARIFKYGYTRDPANLFFVVTSPGGFPYLIKVTNSTKFGVFAQKVIDMENSNFAFTRTYNPKLISGNSTNNEKEFLKMMRDLSVGTGMTLYKGNSGCNEWSRMSIDNFDEVSETPCY